MAATTQVRLLVRSCLQATHTAPIARVSLALIWGVLLLLRRPGTQSSYNSACCRCRCTRVSHCMASESHTQSHFILRPHTSALNFIVFCSPFSFNTILRVSAAPSAFDRPMQGALGQATGVYFYLPPLPFTSQDIVCYSAMA